MGAKLKPIRSLMIVWVALVLSGCIGPLAAQADPVSQVGPRATYADLAAYADAADLVAKLEIRKQATLKPERAPDVPPGEARLYIEARTRALLTGDTGLGEEVAFLVDVMRDIDGDVPKLKKAVVLVFARRVAGRPGELQLVAPDAMLVAEPMLESELRSILQEMVSAGAPPRIAGLRDAISIPGNLPGESETQIFLQTEDGSPASLNILRRPGQAPRWGVSYSDIVDPTARPPQGNTLGWYRLACFLPPALPAEALLSSQQADRARAVADYRLVLDDLGPCRRNRA